MNKKLLYWALVVVLLFSFSACRKRQPAPTSTPIPPAKGTATPPPTLEPDDSNNPVFVDMSDFESNDNGYFGGFANYPEGNDSSYEFVAQLRDIPELFSKGYFLSGNNPSGSLLMYITKSIEALPNTEYSLNINFDIATNVPSNISDIQVDSRLSSFVKVGASNVPFSPIIDEQNYIRSNWDIGSLGNSGSDGRTLGTIEKINSDDALYQYKNFIQTFNITTNEEGMLYVMFAVDTSVTSVVSIYFDNIVIESSIQ